MGANFRYLAPEPSSEMFVDCNICISIPSFACDKYRCVGVYPGFNFRVTALPLKDTKFCTPRKFPAIYTGSGRRINET